MGGDMRKERQGGQGEVGRGGWVEKGWRQANSHDRWMQEYVWGMASF